MKAIFILFPLLCSALSAFDIPKGSHHLGQLDEVAKKAAKKKAPIAFVITQKDLTAT